jgi:hypothetical protein
MRQFVLVVAALAAALEGCALLDRSVTWQDRHPANPCGLLVEWGTQPKDDAALCAEAAASGYPYRGAKVIFADLGDFITGCQTSARIGGCYDFRFDFVYLQPTVPISGSRLGHELRHRALFLSGRSMDPEHRDPIWQQIDAAADAARAEAP